MSANDSSGGSFRSNLPDSVSAIEYDERAELYRVRIDPDAVDHPATAVVEAISAIDGTDPLELEPLAESLDPDRFRGSLRVRARFGFSADAFV